MAYFWSWNLEKAWYKPLLMWHFDNASLMMVVNMLFAFLYCAWYSKTHAWCVNNWFIQSPACKEICKLVCTSLIIYKLVLGKLRFLAKLFFSIFHFYDFNLLVYMWMWMIISFAKKSIGMCLFSVILSTLAPICVFSLYFTSSHPPIH